MLPDELLKKLKETTSSKVGKTLDAIYQVCLEQEQRGLSDFSVATIARLGHKRGVPRAQSLRNKAGESYRALIGAFEEKNKGKNPPKEVKSEDDWIEEIQNPKHRLLARIQASELAAANKKLRDFLPPGTRIEVRDYQNENVEGEDQILSHIERRALEYIISDEFIEKWDFTISECGEIVDGKGRVVFKAATVDAVTKTLNYL